MKKYMLGSVISFFLFIIYMDNPEAKEPGFINYDGDTFKATFRLQGVDTPELKGKCAYETSIAKKAKIFTEKFLKRKLVSISTFGIDKYGRVLAKVSSGEDDLGELLISEGLARKWRGKRESWC